MKITSSGYFSFLLIEFYFEVFGTRLATAPMQTARLFTGSMQTAPIVNGINGNSPVCYDGAVSMKKKNIKKIMKNVF